VYDGLYWPDHELIIGVAITLLPVIVRFKSVGSAPIMKQNYYKITGSHPFSAVHTFLRKELGWAKPGAPGGSGAELVSRLAWGFPPKLIFRGLISLTPFTVSVHQLSLRARS